MRLSVPTPVLHSGLETDRRGPPGLPLQTPAKKAQEISWTPSKAVCLVEAFFIFFSVCGISHKSPIFKSLWLRRRDPTLDDGVPGLPPVRIRQVEWKTKSTPGKKSVSVSSYPWPRLPPERSPSIISALPEQSLIRRCLTHLRGLPNLVRRRSSPERFQSY